MHLTAGGGSSKEFSLLRRRGMLLTIRKKKVACRGSPRHFVHFLGGLCGARLVGECGVFVCFCY